MNHRVDIAYSLAMKIFGCAHVSRYSPSWLEHVLRILQPHCKLLLADCAACGADAGYAAGGLWHRGSAGGGGSDSTGGDAVERPAGRG